VLIFDQLLKTRDVVKAWLFALCLGASVYGSPAYANADLARQKNCFACHSIDKKLLGPAYKDVAAKYDGQPGAVDTLTDKVMNGGSGVWGAAAMPANRVTPAQAQQLVEWVLSLKQDASQKQNVSQGVKQDASQPQPPAPTEPVTKAAISSRLDPNVDKAVLQRGKYLVESILACGNCHSGKDGTWGQTGQPMSGGRSYDNPDHKVTASNLTSDRETGLGNWTANDFKRALADGVRPNGIPLAPAMPWAFTRALTKEDLNAVANYLVTLAPVHNQSPAPIYKREFQNEFYPDAKQPFTAKEIAADSVTRGRYLASLGHCMACHTPTVDGVTDFVRDGGRGGKRLGPNRVLVPNITSHPTAGLGGWTDQDIKRALTTGISRDGHQMGFPMPWTYFATLEPADVDALVAWLRTLPPKD
jgi:cytochrome c551/c552